MTETTGTKGGTKVAVPKIYSAIAAIQAGVGTIPKNGIGPSSQGSYKFVANDDILAVISKLLVENKVIVRPRVLKHTLETRALSSDKDSGVPTRVVLMTVVELETTYISVEDGSEFSVVTSAEGADNGDKGARKAYTQAQKIANLLTFSIATGEPDPDALDVQPVVATQSPAAKKIAAAKGSDAASLANEIKAFLGSSGQAGSVANAVGSRISGGKPSSEWMADVAVLTEVLKELKAGAVE